MMKSTVSQVPPAKKQNESHQGFGENNSQLSLCLNVSHLYISLLYMLSQELVSRFYVFHSPMKNWVLGLAYGTRAIIHEGNTLIGQSIISHGMHYPKNLGPTVSSSYILNLRDGLCNRSLFARRPTNKKRSKKMICTRSAFSINSNTHKISIKKGNKIK
jgi:hypothetical protein